MARCRNLFSGVVVSVGLVCAWITAGQAAVYDSLSAWNLAADPDFVLSAPAVGFEFFGACPYLDGGNCAATGSTTDPFASDASPSGEQTFINDNTTPSWNVSLDATARQNDPLSGATAGTLTSTVAYRVWVLKADNFIIALLFDSPVTSITFSGLHNGLGYLDLGNVGVVPLPAALPLFLTFLAGMGILKWRRRKAMETS